LGRIRKNTTIPIAGGEMNSSFSDFLRMMELESLDVYQPDAVLVGKEKKNRSVIFVKFFFQFFNFSCFCFLLKGGIVAGGISTVLWIIHEIKRWNKRNPNKKQIKFCPVSFPSFFSLVCSFLF
jgi:hypothetical protein